MLPSYRCLCSQRRYCETRLTILGPSRSVDATTEYGAYTTETFCALQQLEHQKTAQHLMAIATDEIACNEALHSTIGPRHAQSPSGKHINHQLNLVENDSLIPAALNQVP